MKSTEIRTKFLKFFESKNHKILQSASLVTTDEDGITNKTLFNTAGMQPLVPYLMGKKHPDGTRLASAQKCVRTTDLEEVGDNTHLTFFEMLGNWSLGDYFKEDAIKYSWEFLTDKEIGLGLDPKRLYITVFAGNNDAPRDDEAYKIWSEIFTDTGLDPENRIIWLADNWWSAGDNGPCGPDSEMFYDLTGKLAEGLTHDEFVTADDEQKIVEIWNDVFMEYEKKGGAVIGKLAQKNIDTGAGLERLTAVLQGKESIFETDLFENVITKIKEIAETGDITAERIIADHIRTAVFLIGDGITPSNTDRGYILRRIIRRAVRYANKLGISSFGLVELGIIVIKQYGEIYPVLLESEEKILDEIENEINKFEKTLEKGLRKFDRIITSSINGGMITKTLSPHIVFELATSDGYPIELIQEEAKERGLEVDMACFERDIKKHQKLSRAGAEKKFKGALADDSVETTELHTVAHLLLAGLRRVLGDDVSQAGSNITAERLRFDFTYPEKVGREKLDQVENWVNEIIARDCDISVLEMEKSLAQSEGVIGNFWDKYPDIVKVYTIKDGDGIYSRELCGGPHIENMSQLHGKKFRITKESASSAGVRRVKGVLE